MIYFELVKEYIIIIIIKNSFEIILSSHLVTPCVFVQTVTNRTRTRPVCG
ncbi:hypothetical protein Hanom_Chr02g00133581 [Helianthus anomalus]